MAGVDARTDPKRVREIIGLAGQYASVEPAMTGLENLRMVARLFGLSRRDANRAADEVLERLDLTEAGSRLVRNYSGGMRRRLDLGASLVGRPQLLLLDEPTTGLDIAAREHLLDRVDELRARHPDLASVLVTHHLEELPASTTHAMLLRDGRVLSQGEADAVLTGSLVSEALDYPLTITRVEGRWSVRTDKGTSARPAG